MLPPLVLEQGEIGHRLGVEAVDGVEEAEAVKAEALVFHVDHHPVEEVMEGAGEGVGVECGRQPVFPPPDRLPDGRGPDAVGFPEGGLLRLLEEIVPDLYRRERAGGEEGRGDSLQLELAISRIWAIRQQSVPAL